MPAAQAQSRDVTYDIVRGIGMILVIYGHLLEPIFPARPDYGKQFIESAFLQWQVIYSFHMMLFFLVSGAVNRNLPKKPWAEVLCGSLRLLALAWIVHIIGLIFWFAFGYAPDASRSLPGALAVIFVPILEGYYWVIGVLWFLTSLCFVQLLAYFVLRRFRPITVAVIAMVATAGSVYLPNYFLLKTWLPGLSFFVLGNLLAEWRARMPFWLCVPLFAAVILLAPLNPGCPFTLTQTCADVGPGLFGVWMFSGVYGFLPLFFLSALLGSLAVLSLSDGLARSGASEILAYIGRNSLNLFILNGFVAVFLNRYIAQIPWPNLTVFLYIGLAVAVVSLHILAMLLSRPVLRWINAAALLVAAFLVKLLTGYAPEPRSKSADRLTA